MKCMLDTNILVSAALFPKSVSAEAYMKAVAPPHRSVVCDYSMEEFRRVFNEKFPHRVPDHDRFVSMMALSVEIVFTPPEEAREESESQIRDVNDRPILRAALAAKVDALITGDKDFLETKIDGLKILSAAGFLQQV
ncbi:MAG: putative toxin-antitoxin system toxin component, PIN family [Proteobacteria bacterium]|nr:putative toxin-antitoxin system toxin component, PIN family [Pseudomonadota bacterium]MCL2307366.1 putative toxin-antitoxin system toxin component, PIN family [Pseudomonadota bacterium]